MSCIIELELVQTLLHAAPGGLVFTNEDGILAGFPPRPRVITGEWVASRVSLGTVIYWRGMRVPRGFVQHAEGDSKPL